MNYKNLYFMLLATVALAFSSCNDENLWGGGNLTPAKPGDKIVFGSTLQYKATSPNKTRTVYGDKGTTGTEIKWYEGDIVRIYCEAATLGEEGESDLNHCDYTVTDYIADPFDEDGNYVGGGGDPTDETYETTHSSGLTTISDASGLYWGSGEHKFYAVYPSPEMLNKYEDDAVAANALTLGDDKITAYLPNLQRPSTFVAPKESETETTTDKDGNSVKKKHYTIHPSMRYAYMVADETVASPSSSVKLTFEPIVTAVEMTLENTGSFAIEGLSLVSLSSSNVICGDFTTEISSRTVTNTSSDDSYKTITIPVAAEGSTIDLNPGDKLTFTAFMIMNTHLSSIDVSLVYAKGVATKKATLKSTATDVNIIQAKTKNFINGVRVGFTEAVTDVELDKWMASISNKNEDGTDKTLSLLSIPAAGGAASGHTANWDSNETFLEQSLTIDELWDQGIRCFEFTVDKHSTTNGDLGSLNVRCNTVDCGITLTNAVKAVKEKLLDHPTEFAMVIITYQQNDGWDSRDQTNNNGSVDYGRSPATFMTQLNTFWTEVTNGTLYDGDEWPVKFENTVDASQIEIGTGTALYSPSMTLADARGKLFCIARPLSEGEDDFLTLNSGSNITSITKNAYPTYTINEKILVVEGWGAMKDKWVRRGYTASAFYRGTGNDAWNDLSTTIKNQLGYDDKPGRPFDVSSIQYDTKTTITYNYIDSISTLNQLSTDFAYNAKNSAGDADFDAWVQEWMRVSDIDTCFYLTYTANNVSYTKDFFWANSTNEKFSNVQETFDKALSDQTGKILYINSLCGYFIDKNIEFSYLPNSLTEMSFYRQLYLVAYRTQYRPLSGASNKAGMSGNISRFAQWMNNKFYNYLLTKDLGGKSTGIIMMDRVSDDATTNPAGYYIPRIILANNPFKEVDGTSENAVMELSLTDELDLDDSDGTVDQIAAPARR